jgi:hypothetical protein
MRGLMLLQNGSCNGVDHLSQVRIGVRRMAAYRNQACDDRRKMKALNHSVLLLCVALSRRKAYRQLPKQVRQIGRRFRLRSIFD